VTEQGLSGQTEEQEENAQIGKKGRYRGKILRKLLGCVEMESEKPRPRLN